MSAFHTISHESDICVVGGGMSGICASIAAARSGSRVTLIHDRPVLGGNASEEIRMWICGAFGANMRETGIIEEIELENIYRNPSKNYSQWSALLHDFVAREPNITMLLNTSVMDGMARPAEGASPRADTASDSGTDGMADRRRLVSVRGWQLTTQTFHEVEAEIFIDCSGDSILAPICGAETRWGREARAEFGESHAPATADSKTMGMSCLIQLKETTEPEEFVPPWFSHSISARDIGPGRSIELGGSNNFWWLEMGGTGDSIADTERNRDDLLGIATGVWEYVRAKNEEAGSGHWKLDWMGFLPGKRESRRYVGDHIITQSEVEAGGQFDDVIAYAGWSMDDHAPEGFFYAGEPTIFHPSPSPWGIPYRSLYSRNVANLLCAGRNISASHIALSSSRVMRTCAGLGQAAGTAASIAVRHKTSPRGVYENHLAELQQSLMEQDVYLPGRSRSASLPDGATIEATNTGSTYDIRLARTLYPDDNEIFSSGLRCGQRTTTEWYETSATADPAALVSGNDRVIEEADNGFWCAPGDQVMIRMSSPTPLRHARLLFDSNLSRYYRDHRMKCNYPLNDPPTPVAESLVRRFTIEAEMNSAWQMVYEAEECHHRLVYVDLPEEPVTAIRFTPVESWGSRLVHLFGFEVAKR